MSSSAGESYDAIVVGVGGWGSAALYQLARRGLKVCGVEQFGVGHDRGSSHGDSRIIRMAYFMHPDYIPVLRRAYELWRELEAAGGEPLMTLNGLLCFGEPEGPLIQGLERCYGAHMIDHERLSPAEAMRRFPQFAIPEDAACYFDPYGGFLRPEACVRAHVAGATAAGATLLGDDPVISLRQQTGSVEVRTSRQTLHARKVVVAAGAYTNQLLGALGGSPIRVVRKVLFWYRPAAAERFAPERFPAWIAEFDGREFYGFPTLDGAVVKAAEDSGGQSLAAPENVYRELLPEDERHLRPFMDRLFPEQIGRRERYKTCLYEQTVDRNFLVDAHPRAPDVIVAAGGSGHGFKFCSVIGEMAADLVELGGAPLRPAIFAAGDRLG
ncbi:MAG TPA: N-methyl-L-tryptophan oxidase [Chthoniobacteraceae bacterium]|jgi:sarcosine oxidase|nr:N-methyl-L-tryptophan oxidase [Chthoniobacteraceae bacterium]